MGAVPSEKEQVRCRQRDDADAGFGQLTRNRVHCLGGHGGELGDMPAGDATLKPALARFGNDQRQVRAIRVQVKICMEIGIGAERFGKIEDAGDMGGGIRVGIGATADEIGAVLERGADQHLSLGLVGQPFLDESAELDIDQVPVIGAERLQRLPRAEPGTRIDLDEAAHGDDAIEHRLLDDGLGTRIDVLDGEGGLGRRRFAHRFGERAGANRHAIEDRRLVEMDVALNKTSSKQITARLDTRRVAGDGRFDGGNPSARHADIHRRGLAVQHRPGNNEIQRRAHA